MVTDRFEATGSTHPVSFSSTAAKHRAFERTRKADSVAVAITSFARSVSDNYQTWRRAARIRDGLSRMDDHLLKDIGLHRTALAEASWQMAQPGTETDKPEKVFAFPEDSDRAAPEKRNDTMRRAA